MSPSSRLVRLRRLCERPGWQSLQGSHRRPERLLAPPPGPPELLVPGAILPRCVSAHSRPRSSRGAPAESVGQALRLPLRCCALSPHSTHAGGGPVPAFALLRLACWCHRYRSTEAITPSLSRLACALRAASHAWLVPLQGSSLRQTGGEQQPGWSATTQPWSSLQPEASERRVTSLCGPGFQTPPPSRAQSFWVTWMQVRADRGRGSHAGPRTETCTCCGLPNPCLQSCPPQLSPAAAARVVHSLVCEAAHVAVPVC